MTEPKSIPLSGADYFHLLLDRHMRKAGGEGNIGRFLIRVNGRVSKEELETKLNNEGIFKWLSSVNYQKPFPFFSPRWVLSKLLKISVSEQFIQEENPSIERLARAKLSIKKAPLLQFDLFHLQEEKTILILTWHHAIMDAHGAEMAIKLLSGKVHPGATTLFPTINPKTKFVEQLNKAKEAKDFLLSATPPVLASALKTVDRKNAKTNYHVISFSKEETELIEVKSKALGVRFGLSPLYLAGICRSIHKILKDRNTFEGDFWVPVPQDQRLRGSFGPIVSNQVSFLFYRITPSDLLTLKTTVDSISTQMIQQIREGTTKTYAEMMNLFRHLPLGLYSSLVKGPTKGAIASFFFSDTGDSLKDLDTLMDKQIEDAVHFPPNIYPPGFTSIFMKFQGKLKVVLGYTEYSFEREEVLKLERLLRTALCDN